MIKKEKIEELIDRGTEQIIVKSSLAKKLSSGKPLRVKLGVDPTAPRLHLGHTVVLRKLRQFQELGHQVIFLIGDFTARIGDPSDRLAARKPLTDKEIQENIKTYKQQVGKVLDLTKVEIRNNSEWHSNMDFAELFQLTSYFTVNQMLERDMYKERMKKKKPLWIHEFLYPILQGYDSVALQADVELGGTDQTFNLLAARDIQPHYHQPPQDILTVPLIEGTDGKDKMSKSVGNTIDLQDTPKDMYGKTMSIPDKLIIKYFTLLTDVPLSSIKEYEKAMSGGANPKDYKAKLAQELVKMYHGNSQAITAAKEFNSLFKENKIPSDIPEYKIQKEETVTLLDIVANTKLATSRGEARRLIEQGAVQVDGQQIKGWKSKIQVKNGLVIKVGKRKFIKLVIKK
ncbi:tyrosine--tRNA ligase [Patescibacteria group bacterium]|nr:tyrosine--tRNA ligase [Patescibacteria group bacterium]